MTLRFSVKKAQMPFNNCNTVDYWIVVENNIPLLDVNEYLCEKSQRCINTGKRYAHVMATFLNYLDLIGIQYTEVKRKDIKQYIKYLLFGSENSNLATINPQCSYSNINVHLSAVVGFYRWVDDEHAMVCSNNISGNVNPNSFLYGQVWQLDYSTTVESFMRRFKPNKTYLKWYSEEEKEALRSNFLTLRDKVIFDITLEGLRIDEALSIHLSKYDRYDQVIFPSRSKGIEEESENMRPIYLSQSLCEEIDTYIFTERANAEAESEIINDWLFINLKKGANQGKPLSYNTFYSVLKRCARRAGLDPKAVRTHSGRSTKTMELLEYQVLYPESNLTDEMIRQIMGWSSSESLKPYKNHNNTFLAKTAAEKINQKRDDKNNED